MLLIVMHHVIVHGSFDYKADTSILGKIVQLLAIGGRVGVNGFIMLTGYFSYKSSFNFKKIMSIVLQVYTSVIIILLVSLLWKRSYSTTELLYFLNPFSNSLWFVREFVFLLMMAPYLNGLIAKLSESRLNVVLLIGLLLFVLLPSFVDLGFFKSNIFWFSYLYLVAGTYHKYYTAKLSHPQKIGTIVSLLMIVVAYFAFTLKFTHLSGAGVGQQNSIFMLGLTMALFLFFEVLPLGHSKVINRLARLTFGVYIFHDFPIMRDQLIAMIDLSRISQFSLITAIPYVLFYAVAIFTISAILEFIRQRIFTRGNNHFITQFTDYFMLE